MYIYKSNTSLKVCYLDLSKKKCIQDKNNLFYKLKKIPPAHNRTNGVI